MEESVRAALENAASLHEHLKETAARAGEAAEPKATAGIRRLVPPIIPSLGMGPIDLTSEEIYELIEFP